MMSMNVKVAADLARLTNQISVPYSMRNRQSGGNLFRPALLNALPFGPNLVWVSFTPSFTAGGHSFLIGFMPGPGLLFLAQFAMTRMPIRTLGLFVELF